LEHDEKALTISRKRISGALSMKRVSLLAEKPENKASGSENTNEIMYNEDKRTTRD